MVGQPLTLRVAVLVLFMEFILSGKRQMEIFIGNFNP